MKTMLLGKRLLAVAGVAAALLLTTGSASAQQERPQGGRNRGNFDPEQFRARMMERYREQFDVQNDDEWKLIETRINAVMEARRDVGFGGPRFGRGGRGGGPGGDQAGNDRGGRGGFRGEPDPEAEALQKAIEAKAPADEIKAKLAKYRDSRKAKEAKLEAAQEDLRKVLSVRQEATGVMMGLLK